jgi:hypothetical protein
MSDVKGRSGRKQFVATQEQRDIVKDLAGRAVPQALICRVILNPQTGKPISEPTLRRAFRSEIDTGQTLVSAMVGSMLVSAALGTKPPCGPPIKGDMARLKAAMFFLERRAGWTQGLRRRFPASLVVGRNTRMSPTQSSGSSLSLPVCANALPPLKALPWKSALHRGSKPKKTDDLGGRNYPVNYLRPRRQMSNHIAFGLGLDLRHG